MYLMSPSTLKRLTHCLVCHFKVYELFGNGTLSIYVPIQNTRLINIIKTDFGSTKRVNKSIHYFFFAVAVLILCIHKNVNS